jgi:D-beta-D-heptose 7-phosphate kinase/D-beta-D-heptose 1-phosphate adenosyltransferase
LTPLKLINIIEPDFLVKGGDYKPNNIVGAKEIVKWGGVVKIIKLTPGFSTTDSIKKSKL